MMMKALSARAEQVPALYSKDLLHDLERRMSSALNKLMINELRTTFLRPFEANALKAGDGVGGRAALRLTCPA